MAHINSAVIAISQTPNPTKFQKTLGTNDYYWGVVRGPLAAAGLSPKAATIAHGTAIYGAAQVTLPALEIAPPSIFWGKQEVAIDAFHHAACAAGTDRAYPLIEGQNGTSR